MIYIKGGVHPLDIPPDALTTNTWWKVMQVIADYFETMGQRLNELDNLLDGGTDGPETVRAREE